MHAKRTGFVVEHDFIMATYLADRVIVLEGRPSVETTAYSPQSLLNGMNRFLELLGITFRRDPNNFRPRINKNNSVKVSFLFLLLVKLIPIIISFRILNKNVPVNSSFWKMMANKFSFTHTVADTVVAEPFTVLFTIGNILK